MENLLQKVIYGHMVWFFGRFIVMVYNRIMGKALFTNLLIDNIIFAPLSPVSHKNL